MKQILSILAAMLLLLSMSGCAQAEYPSIEDTFANALDGGNTYAAEQGDWIAMKSQGKEGKGILLYNKKKQKSRFLVRGDYEKIGLLENKVFYCSADEQRNLYCFDLASGEEKLLATNVKYYQAREGMVYFNTAADTILHTIRLESGMQSTLKLSYIPERFWLTDYGFYYYSKDAQRLMVLPNDAQLDRFVLQSSAEILDLASIKGARILFLCQGQGEGAPKLLQSFNPADRQIKEHYQTEAEHFTYVRNRAVLAEKETLCSIDIEKDQVYSWGSIAGATDAQLLSECAVSYQEGLPTIVYYAKSE